MQEADKNKFKPFYSMINDNTFFISNSFQQKSYNQRNWVRAAISRYCRTGWIYNVSYRIHCWFRWLRSCVFNWFSKELRSLPNYSWKTCWSYGCANEVSICNHDMLFLYIQLIPFYIQTQEYKLNINPLSASP